MPTSYRIHKSLHGRELGLSNPSTNETGIAADYKFLVGPDAYRTAVSSAASTATDLRPWGVHYLPTSSAGSSQVYTISAPVPGTGMVTVAGGTASEVYLKTKNSETFVTSGGSSFTTLNPSSLGFTIGLVALTTALWGVINGTTAAGHAYTTST